MISVVIPTHRRGQLVVRAVESLLVSSIKPAEIIVVEDQSHEALISLDKYINSGLVKYFQKPDDSSGAASTRNYGVNKVSQKYVLFLDDDDTLYPHYIAELLEILSNSKFHWGFGDIVVGGKVAKYRCRKSGELRNIKFRRKMVGLGAGFWIERTTFQSLGGLDEAQTIDEDTDLCCRLIGKGLNPWYLKTPAVNVSRRDGVERLTQSNDIEQKLECYTRTLVNNFKYFHHDPDACAYLIDRVHRVICKNGDLGELTRLSKYRIPAHVQLIHHLREMFIKFQSR